MNSREERTRLMAEGEMGSVLWKFAIPAIASALISAIYNIVDTMFVGLLNDTSALGAVSVAFPVFLLINSVGQMYGVGAASYIARLLGGDEKENADKVASTVTWVAFGTGVVLTGLVMVFLRPTLRILGATDTILPLAIEYSIPLVLGSVFAILMPTLANIIRSEGNTKFSAIAIGAGGVANIILDPIFIFSFDMGVKGAAVATALSQVLTVVILISYFVRKKNFIEIKIKKFAPSIKMFREVLTVGTATFLTQALISLSMGMLNSASKPYGDSAIAAIGITLRVSALVLFVVIGYNQGFQPVASFNYGAKNFERLKEAINISIKRISIFSVVTTLLLWIFAKQAIVVFSSDPEVVEIGAKALRFSTLMFPLLGYQQLYAILFQALGKGKEALITSIARQGIFFVPAIIILPKLFGLDGVLLTQAVADFFTILLTIVLASKLKKDLREEEKEATLNGEVALG